MGSLIIEGMRKGRLGQQSWSLLADDNVFRILMTDLKSLKPTEEFCLKKNEALQQQSNL